MPLRTHLSGTAIAAALSVLLGTAAWAAPVTITIAHVNDLDRMEASEGRGGLARLAGALAEIRKTAPDLLVTHGGDAISPSLMSGFDHGAHIIDLFNALPLDAMTLGNHEFDFGPVATAERVAEARFPVLSANTTGTTGTKPHVLFTRGGYTLGVFGLTTPDTPVLSSPGDVTFRDPVATAKEQAAALRSAGADLVIALTHTSLAEDAELFQAGAADVILSGHDHVLRMDYDGRTAFVESASQADYVTVLDLTVDRVKDRSGAEKVVWRPSFRTIDTATVAPDPAMAAKVAAYEQRLSSELDVAIGRTDTALDSRRSVIRGEEAAIGNLIADAMRAATGADVALMNGGGIRADKQYPAGTTLTRRDIQAELPFGNRTVTLEVTGAALRAALEHGLGRVEARDGRFPQISGIALAYDPSAPAGGRVHSVSVNGAPLDDAKTYVLATNDFTARGGDGYAMFAKAPRRIDENAGRLVAAQVIEHVQTAESVAPKVEGRIAVVK